MNPGFVETDSARRYAGAEYESRIRGEWIAITPLRRVAVPEEIASVIAFLCGGDSSFVTGQTLIADGGLTLGGAWDAPGRCRRYPSGSGMLNRHGPPGPEPARRPSTGSEISTMDRDQRTGTEAAVPSRRPDVGRSRWAGVLFGIGLMAAVDEIVFHQLLGWHHFYDGATPTVGLLTDGLLHSAELIALVGAFLMLLDLARSGAISHAWSRAGFFLGAGGFQLFDGIVDHKVLRLHQIRYGVDLLPYDLAWNGAGLVLIIIGTLLAVRARSTAPAAG